MVYNLSKSLGGSFVSEFIVLVFYFYYFILFFSFTFISWRLMTLQYHSGSCHTLT